MASEELRARYEAAEHRREVARLATLYTGQEGSRILASLPRDPDSVIAQRREDLLAAELQWLRRRKRDRIMRKAATS